MLIDLKDERNAWPNDFSGVPYSTERIDHVDHRGAEQHDHRAWPGAEDRLQGVRPAAAEGHLVQGRQVHQSQAQRLPIQASQVSVSLLITLLINILNLYFIFIFAEDVPS